MPDPDGLHPIEDEKVDPNANAREAQLVDQGDRGVTVPPEVSKPTRLVNNYRHRRSLSRILPLPLVLLLLCVAPATSVRIPRAHLCPSVDLNFANLVGLNDNLQSAITSWAGTNLTKFHGQAGFWKGAPFFIITGSSFAAVQRSCNKKEGNLIEVHSYPELYRLNELMTNLSMKSTLFNLKYDPAEKVPKWSTSDTIFFLTSLDDELPKALNSYSGYIEYQMASPSRNNTWHLSHAVTPEGVPAVCVKKPSTLSADIQDLQTRIASDLRKFNAQKPDTNYLLRNILRINDLTETSLLLPSTSKCMSVLIEAAGQITFHGVTYIKDKATYFAANKC